MVTKIPLNRGDNFHTSLLGMKPQGIEVIRFIYLFFELSGSTGPESEVRTVSDSNYSSTLCSPTARSPAG